MPRRFLKVIKLNAQEVNGKAKLILSEMNKVVVGKNDVVMKMLAAIFANGHILIEDFPGLAKTLIARSFAAVIGCDFRRIQFTPDLLPSDVTGSSILNRKSNEFELRKGPVFTNILLADEINRAPPKTQSALLEAMQERQATIEGKTYGIEKPFIVMATQNPIEYEGTYPLPEAQLDRFMMKISVGYPTKDEEASVLSRRRERKIEGFEISPAIDRETLLSIQRETEEVHVSREIEQYIVDVVRATRMHRSVEIGASPRGSLSLMRLSMAGACVRGRDFVTPDDVKEYAVNALAHRLILKPDPWLRGVKSEQIVSELLEQVNVPKVD
ncbi:MAG: MoxR family ATPase [Thermoplasmata archaeon]|nr:MoxR family ATPase [Candidatus Sysuiplasma acidicola]MBX8646542.1 MoxR family ATPase [Candidatus Sysuiplasma acidicola]